MKKWNKTVLSWPKEKRYPEMPLYPFLTDIKLARPMHAGAAFKVCLLTKFEIESGATCAAGSFCFKNPDDGSSLCGPENNAVIKRFSRLVKQFDISALELHRHGTFHIRIELKRHEQFCDVALKFAEAALKVLGIEDLHRWKLAHFDLTQTTYIEVRMGATKTLIPFEHWLKREHKLPVAP